MKDHTKAIEMIVKYAKALSFSEHWVGAKNYAIRNGIDKDTAKSAAIYVSENPDEFGVKVVMCPHGPHLKPARYFAGKNK